MAPKTTAGFEVHSLSRLIKRYLDHTSTKRYVDPLTGTHGWVIKYLYERQGQDTFQRDLENQFSIRRSTATGILQLMEKNEMIIRQPVDYDARLKKIILTEKAKDCHKMIEAAVEEVENKLVQGLSENELELFFSVIHKMKKNME